MPDLWRTNVRDHGAVGDGVADDTDAIRQSIEAAVSNGTRHVFFPSGTYRAVTPIPRIDGVTLFTVPSDFVVSGVGPPSTIRWEGDVHPEDGNITNSCFYVADGTSNVAIEGLHFVGNNGTAGNEFNAHAGVSNCVLVLLTLSEDITIRRCSFDDLHGFSVHDAGENTRVNVIDCETRWCANGINVNANYSVQTGNRVSDSEGFEASGAGVNISNNTILRALGVGISCGGNQGAGAEFPGSVVVGNVVDQCTGVGIVLADGFVDGVCASNTIRHCHTGGIQTVAGGGGHRNRGCLITGNQVINNCAPGSGNIWGINLGGQGWHVVVGNRVVSDDPEWNQQYAVFVQSPNCFISGNVLDGKTQDLFINNGVSGTVVGENNYVNQTTQFLGSAPSTVRRYGKAKSDVVETSTLHSPACGPGLYYFHRTAGGEHRWDGAQGGGFDTNLYRSAANQLKTDDKLLAALGLGVGNSTPATSLGAVCRKMEIFDASGASLGFIAIHEAGT